MKKWVVALLILLCVAAGGINYWLDQNNDNIAPVITIPDGAELIYKEGEDTSVLLEGVTAVDDKDGDVSDTLIVESILPMQDESKATVLYYARDNSNNVARASRIVEYRAKDSIAWMSEPESETSEAESESEEVEESDDMKNLPKDYPRIYLTTDKVTVKQGESYNLLSYVKEITDDQDGPDWLYYQIHIDGMSDINGPGTYELYYTVIDRDYHTSNRAKLTLTIEP